MKTIFTLATLILSTTAWAMPKVGDQAVYNGSYTSATQTQQYTVERHIVSQDATSGAFNIDSKMTANGVSEVRSEAVEAKDLLTAEVVTQAVQNCALFGGVNESVTVPAGTFNTCAVPNNGGTVWVAEGVPFGAVKANGPTDDGGKFEMELQSFVNGQ